MIRFRYTNWEGVVTEYTLKEPVIGHNHYDDLSLYCYAEDTMGYTRHAWLIDSTSELFINDKKYDGDYILENWKEINILIKQSEEIECLEVLDWWLKFMTIDVEHRMRLGAVLL